MKTNDGIWVDIQFNNFEPLLGTLYIKTYLEVPAIFSHFTSFFQQDPRLAILIIWLKDHLKKVGLLNSRTGLFASYHVVLFVLHFINVRFAVIKTIILQRRLPGLEVVPRSDVLSSLEQISWKEAADRLLENVSYFNH